MNEKYYAHSLKGQPLSEWQELDTHLAGTAKRAAEMASEFNCSGWGNILGLWHDLGKYSPDFQSYIKNANDDDAHIEGTKIGRVDHSTAGATYAIEKLGLVGRILAYQIAGHHAGLPDYEADNTGNASLSQRIQHYGTLDQSLKELIPLEILNQSVPFEKPPNEADPAFWVRILFSCLVDADFLDTEAFYNPEQALNRAKYPEISQLLKVFDEYMQIKRTQSVATEVNVIRSQVLKQCVSKAEEPPGIYTLTVPTGGGKTLSSMGFALHHAAKYKKRRIIYVIPYTSIIEQTAEQFRTIFGDAVIEHQSNLDTSDENKDNARSRLACENWDAPVIVTTSVQFFESLFASRTSRCRKLHNIVNSIVVLDEVQLLPPEFLNPILNVIQELQKNYGVTFLLSTATQPALGPQKSLDYNFKGLTGMKEIIDEPAELHNQLKRVEITIPKNFSEPTSWDKLVPELTNYKSVLCIVNRRDDCRLLWEKMPLGTFHLSALMCGQHRSATIGIIKERLRSGLPTRVISTQLVEAGVDFDFPVVYRALAGLDSIAQAAGRCNREGLLGQKGQVVVFTPSTLIPPGQLRQAAQIGQQLLSEECADILALDRFEEFFKKFYWVQGPRLDKYKILADLRMQSDFRCSFRSAATKFHLIDDSTQASVVVAYKEGRELIRLLQTDSPDRQLLRKLQRFVVNIPRYQHSKLLAEGAIKEVHPGIFVQLQASMYDENLGYCIDHFGNYQPDELYN